MTKVRISQTLYHSSLFERCDAFYSCILETACEDIVMIINQNLIFHLHGVDYLNLLTLSCVIKVALTASALKVE